jgi:hypothetical protein
MSVEALAEHVGGGKSFTRAALSREITPFQLRLEHDPFPLSRGKKQFFRAPAH